MKISQQDGDLCCGPRSLAGGAKGEEEISISANTLEVDAGYLGSTCKPPCEQQGTKVLMKALGRRVGLAALGAGAELCCRRQPGPADIILLGTEGVETFPFAPCSVGTQGLLCPTLLHFSLSPVPEAQQDISGREKHYKSYSSSNGPGWIRDGEL